MSFGPKADKRHFDFQHYVKQHHIWKEINGNIALEEFVRNELVHAILSGSLLSSDLDAIPMRIVYDYIDEKCFGGSAYGREKFTRDSFQRKVVSLIHRMHASLRVRCKFFGGKRYSCLCVVKQKGD
jgi:hypothetical protein